ncbi:MAG: hypothetical protein AB1443_06535 [Pseudomonadota bacterium]
MRFLWLVLSLLATSGARAEAEAPPPEPLTPVSFGYGFDNPDILLRQRIFGIAHGVHLLLSACLDKNENAEAVQQSYDAWHATQEKVLEEVREQLAAYHFGAQAPRAHWQDVARVLGLKETVYPSLGEVSLPEACATLPQALAQSRYDFAEQLKVAEGSGDAIPR